MTQNFSKDRLAEMDDYQAIRDERLSKEQTKTARHGQFRVLHFPQIPCKPFEVLVPNIKDARLTQNFLAQYDLFLLAENHRVDFSNISFIQVWDDECPDDEGSCWIDIDDDEYDEIQKYGAYEEYKQSQHTS